MGGEPASELTIPALFIYNVEGLQLQDMIKENVDLIVYMSYEAQTNVGN